MMPLHTNDGDVFQGNYSPLASVKYVDFFQQPFHSSRITLGPLSHSTLELNISRSERGKST